MAKFRIAKMYELPNGVDTDRGRRWLMAIARGIVVCVLTLALLTVAAMLCLPYITDTVEGALFATVWAISIGLGIREVLKHRPKS